MDMHKKLVWSDENGSGRNLISNFRRVFEITEVPQSAAVSIFGDSYYQLFVNGVFVGFGPVRFDPKHPVYDEYDVAKYLVKGKNSICAIVNYFGMKTYKSIASNAGFFFEGQIGTNDLSSELPGWKCIEAPEHSEYANKISFALSAADYYTQSSEKWMDVDYDDSNWCSPVLVSRQDVWGAFEKREMPFMSLKSLTPNSKVDVFPNENTSDIYSIAVPMPSVAEEENPYNSFIAFGSWIYSPCKQTVPVTCFWGETWLNGVETSGVEDEYKNLRIVHSMEFNEGWNEFSGKVGAYMDCVQQFFAVPKSANLVFSATKSLDSEYSFMHTLPVLNEKFDEYLAKKDLPLSLEDNLNEIGGWQFVKRDERVTAPCRWYSLTDLGAVVERCSYDELNGKVFPYAKYPNGFTMNVDLGKTTLAFIKIRVRGAKGATINFVGSEKLCKDSRYVYTNPLYHIGFSAKCTEDECEYLSLYPMGMRYCAVNVMGAGDDFVIENIDFLDASYPTEAIGSFESSDPMLNNIWKICANTQATNMEDAYVDCVGRERGMYIRDTIIQYYNNLAIFGDHALMKRCMQLYGQSPDATGKYRAVYPNTGTYTISDFCLNVIEGYYIYYLETGDIDSIKRDWEAMKTNLLWFDQLADTREDMLLDSAWDIKSGIKASYGGFHGDLGVKPDEYTNKGVHCEFSCTYLIAMQCMITLAKAIGMTEDADYYQKRCDVLSKSISENLFDDTNGMFKNIMEAEEFYSYHPSIFAIRAESLTDEQKDKICKYISRDFKSVFVNGYNSKDGVYFSPSYSFYILEGLYKAGLVDIAQNFIKSSWGVYLVEGITTVPEYHNYSGGTSVCHAWSAAPLYFLSKNMSGVTYPNAPDKSYVEINVQAEGVEWAKVKWPYANGDVITVEWHMEDGKRIFDKVEVPEGVSYKIVE